ncbi:hypothetical protein V2J09_021285 [Rumex salicifolius]
MIAKLLTLPEPKRPKEVGKTDDPKYCPYHRLISHPITNCYVLKDIIERMINKGVSSKALMVLSNTISTLIDQEFESLLEDFKSEGMPTVSLPPMAIPIQFRRVKPTQPTLYEVMMQLDANELFSDDDKESKKDNNSRWTTCISKKKPP